MFAHTIIVACHLILVVLIAGCAPDAPPPQTSTIATSAPPPPPPPPPPTATSSPSGREWKEFVSTEGKYKVMFPGTEVEHSVHQSPTAAGTTATRHMDLVTVGEGEAYSVNRTDTGDPPPDPDAHCRFVSENAINAMVNAMGGKIESQSERTISGRKAYTYKVSGNIGGRAMTQYVSYLVSGDSLYQIVCFAPSAGPSDEDAERFISSFQLTE